MHEHLVLTLAARWRREPDAVAIALVDDAHDDVFTGARLDAHVAAAAGALAAAGVGPGTRVGLVLPTCAAFWPAFFACWWLGATPVPLAPPDPRVDPMHEAKRLFACLGVAGARLAVAPAALIERVPPGLFPFLAAEALDGPALAPRPADELALIQFSSGSTGRPRGVALGFAQLAAQVALLRDRLGDDPQGVGVSWLPLHHDMGLIGTLYCIASGYPAYLIPPEQFVLKPARWPRALSRYRATITAAPNFGYALAARLSPAVLGPLDLSALRVAMAGAEPVRPATMAAFAQRYAADGLDPGALMPSYGLAEATLAVALSPPGRGVMVEALDRSAYEQGLAVPTAGVDGAIEVVACGPPLLDVRVAIRAEDGRALAEREVGEVWLQSPCLMQGYLGDETEALVAGWLRTGDLGYMAEGELFISGRAKDLIIRAGAKFHPHDLEAAAEGVPGVRGGGACCFFVAEESRERVVMLVEARDPGQAAALPEAVRTRVHEHSGLRLDEVVPVAAGSLPKTTSGKPRRAEARSRFLAGRLTGLHA